MPALVGLADVVQQPCCPYFKMTYHDKVSLPRADWI